MITAEAEPPVPPATPEQAKGIIAVVDSQLPARDDGFIFPPASSKTARVSQELALIFLSHRMGYMKDKDRAMALLRCLAPRELWLYYNLYLPLAPWMERWIYGFETHTLLDPVAPPGLSRMFWAFKPFPRELLERGYLYGLSLQPEVPQGDVAILQRISYADGQEISKFKKDRWRKYELYVQRPFAFAKGGDQRGYRKQQG